MSEPSGPATPLSVEFRVERADGVVVVGVRREAGQGSVDASVNIAVEAGEANRVIGVIDRSGAGGETAVRIDATGPVTHWQNFIDSDLRDGLRVEFAGWLDRTATTGGEDDPTTP